MPTKKKVAKVKSRIAKKSAKAGAKAAKKYINSRDSGTTGSASLGGMRKVRDNAIKKKSAKLTGKSRVLKKIAKKK